MRSASSIVLIAGITTLLLADPAPRPVMSTRGDAGAYPATVEPTLPLSIDLQFGNVERTRSGWNTVLHLAIDADQDFPEVSLRLILPDEVRAEPGPWMSDLDAFRALRGSRRTHTIPLSAASDGVFAIQIEASIKLANGESFKTRQGRTLHVGRKPGDGRYHAGAYEVFGVPIADTAP